MSKHLWWYRWWLSITLVSLSVISCTKSKKSGQHTPVGVSHRGPCRPHPFVVVTVTTLSPHHAVYLINHWFLYMLWIGLKALIIAVMHVTSYPVMLIMQSNPVGCSSICLQNDCYRRLAFIVLLLSDWQRIIVLHRCCVLGCTSNSRDKTKEAVSFHFFLK